MDKKVIAIIRTSTIQQEIDSQREEVLSMAIADGYAIDEIEVVGRAGASAIKVDESYRENMNKVYELIDNIPTIEAVYAWAVDRIGRNEEILMKLKNTLISKKIQLVIKEPSLRLLDANGNVNSAVELLFGFVATVSKQEMEQKQARFRRARKRNDEMGKYNGGYVAFGYMVKDGYIVINEEEAAVVRLIFKELASGKYSCDSLARELSSRGITFRGEKLLFSNVRGIVKNPIYCGKQVAASGAVRNTPQIVSEELYDEAIQAMHNNNPSKTNSTTNRYLFGLRLIKCPVCGCHFSVASRLYCCHNHNRNYYDSRDTGFTKCTNGISIGQKNLDRLLWYAAAEVHFAYLQQLKSNRDSEIDAKIEILTQKIDNLNTEIDTFTEKRKRIDEVYMDGGISKEAREKRLAKLVKDKEGYALQIRDFESEINGLQALKSGDFGNEILFDNLANLLYLDNKELQCKIVRKHIKNITLEKDEYEPYKRVLRITIQFFNHPDMQFMYLAKSLGEFFTMTNGELDKDADGNLVAIPNLEKERKYWSKDNVTNYQFIPQIIALQNDDTVRDKADEIKQQYNLTDDDIEFISKTASMFSVGTPTAKITAIIERLKQNHLIVAVDTSVIPI